MTKKLLARDQKKAKEIISSILYLVHDDFWGSQSPGFCSVMTLSIHIALMSQELKVLQRLGKREVRTIFALFPFWWLLF